MDTYWMYTALGVYLLAMLFLGYVAYKKTSTHEDYMVGGRQLPPLVAALSAGASDMSGWLIMGLPGAIYTTGLIESWIAIGLTIGAFLNWKFVAPRLRAYSQVAKNSITVPSFFENRLKDSSHILRIVSSIIILVFFTLYISSGMVASGVFFESSFNGNYIVGMLIVVSITLLYTFFGGFLGASLTDVAQGLMMMVALGVVPVVGVISIGGIGAATETIRTVASDNLSFIGYNGFSMAVAFSIVSGIAWGLGYFGQPHIVVRFMALRTPAEAKSARRIGMSWMIVSLGCAILSGLVGIAYFSHVHQELPNPETVILRMSQLLLHPFIAGLILAAVLAAIMSTFASQLVVCSSALVEDLYRVVRKKEATQKQLVLLGRLAVLLVALVALLLALNPSGTILQLVSFAWAGFGASFGPITLLSLYWKKLTNWGALAGMLSGAISVFVWDAINSDIYELLPAFLIATLIAVIVSKVTYKEHPEITEEFSAMKDMLAQP
ncbi:sodium/proline symporter PutP [Schaalia sp. lx-260]|uniref:sodium/proline symporter PutP n=1 Tax=Schaalia sp. lx-260 TaxID=2899082 RepID=UPI001E44611D|nr:sodium/proline symporter PutP [Schaalia sp. lx-260]MCD4549468.1 sodium/proline symporter PutP [Schaalia sp. lx-260]